MGEAKIRKGGPLLVYHHTSTLYTNQIWMSGAVEVEGKNREPPAHPQMGQVQSDLRFRRAFKDFPPLAWFTTQISVPKCLILDKLIFVHKDSGEVVTELPISEKIANGIALRRMALGFPISTVPVKRWPDYHGYGTAEGKELNETARDYGDNPEGWYVSEERVSLDHMTEIRVAKSMQNLKMERQDGYLQDIKRLLAMLKVEKAYVPPAWLSRDVVEEAARRMNMQVRDP
jgi:hypothetical protein